MRTLNINKKDIWYTLKLGEKPLLDDEGYDTGEIEDVYTKPIKTKLHLYPATGDVVQKTFGKELDVDMITSTNIMFKKDTILSTNNPDAKICLDSMNLDMTWEELLHLVDRLDFTWIELGTLIEEGRFSDTPNLKFKVKEKLISLNHYTYGLKGCD